MENRNPVKSIAWIFVLVFVPIVGFLFYILVGKKFRKKRIISKRSLRFLKKYEATSDRLLEELPLSENQRMLAALATSNSASPLFQDNKVDIYIDAVALYDRMIDDIKNAKHHINVEYYIFCPDKIGRRMMEALMEKAREGVLVKVIVDDVGSWQLKKKHIQELSSAGVVVKSFLEVGLPYINSRVNYRNHRKIVVIDGEIGYTGGMNVADRYLEGLKWGAWRDTHVRMEGSVVVGLQKTFFDDWYFVTQKLEEASVYYPEPKKKGDVWIQTVISGPDMQWESIMQVYAKAFAQATKRIYLETPYFMPPESIITTLQSASLSGVDVRLILPRRSDAIVTLYSSYSYLDQMFESGVKVYLYQPGFIHSKVSIVDDDIAFVGSANMDFRSFEQNFEMNTIIYNKEVTGQLLEIFDMDQRNSVELTREGWANRPSSNRIKESVARLFSPLL